MLLLEFNTQRRHSVNFLGQNFIRFLFVAFFLVHQGSSTPTNPSQTTQLPCVWVFDLVFVFQSSTNRPQMNESVVKKCDLHPYSMGKIFDVLPFPKASIGNIFLHVKRLSLRHFDLSTGASQGHLYQKGDPRLANMGLRFRCQHVNPLDPEFHVCRTNI